MKIVKLFLFCVAVLALSASSLTSVPLVSGQNATQAVIQREEELKAELEKILADIEAEKKKS